MDLKIDAAKEQIEERKQKIVRMQNEIENDAQLVDKKVALLKKIQLRKKKAETALQETGHSIRAAEMKMQNSGVSPNVYSALERELAGLKSRNSEIETSILEDMEKLEVLEKDTQKGAKVIAGRREHLEQVKARVTDEILAIKKQIELLKTERSQISLKIDADRLEKYEELRQRKKGKVLFGVDSPSCQACGMGLPAGFVSSITTSDEADYCSNCGVFLYWTGLKD
jgi:predicted  nucleic acid-binding Zn-ribbon protein